jgi:hypothetical protein
MYQVLGFVTLFASLAVRADAAPFGAPKEACTELPPETYHGGRGNGDGGFSFEFSPALPSESTYAPDTEYKITFKGEKFMAFAIVPLTPDTVVFEPVTDMNTKSMISCNGLTHKDPNPKESIVVTWKAPSSGTASSRWVWLKGEQATPGHEWFVREFELNEHASTTGGSDASDGSDGSDGHITIHFISGSTVAAPNLAWVAVAVLCAKIFA